MYQTLIYTKDFNVLIEGKSFFDLLVKNEEEAYEKFRYMNNNNEMTIQVVIYWILVILKKITN